MRSEHKYSLPTALRKWVNTSYAKRGFGSADEYLAEVVRRDKEHETRTVVGRLLVQEAENGASSHGERSSGALTTEQQNAIDDFLEERLNGPSSIVTEEYWEKLRRSVRRPAKRRHKK